MPMKPRGQGVKVYKISKDGDSWKLVAEGGSRATFVSATRTQAVKKAERLLSGKMAKVLIHDPHGLVVEARTYLGEGQTLVAGTRIGFKSRSAAARGAFVQEVMPPPKRPTKKA